MNRKVLDRMIISLLVVTILYLTYGVLYQAENVAERVANPAFTCEFDTDCTAVSHGCCPCEGSGTLTGIRSDAALVFEATKSCWAGEEDTLIKCPQSYSSHWTCLGAEPRCRKGVCMMVRTPPMRVIGPFTKII